jgi:hypothetical protein
MDHQAMDQGGDRAGLVDRALGVRYADLERAETWMDAQIPPDHRGVGQAARFHDFPDRREEVVVAENARGTPVRGKLRSSAARAEARPESQPCQNFRQPNAPIIKDVRGISVASCAGVRIGIG